MTALAASADRTMRLPLLFCVLAWILAYLWLARFRLVVTEESLTYRTLLRGTVSYPMRGIRRIRRESGVREYTDRFKPFVRLVVEPTAELGAATDYVNLKVFNVPAVRGVIGFLKLKYKDLGMPHVVDDSLSRWALNLDELIC